MKDRITIKFPFEIERDDPAEFDHIIWFLSDVGGFHAKYTWKFSKRTGMYIGTFNLA